MDKLELYKLIDSIQEKLSARFKEIDAVSERVTVRVLDAFREHRVSDACFAGTSGYGYGDKGRDTLDQIYAEVFGAESALVRIGFVNGTHAITAALFAALSPGDILLSVTGRPYDTLLPVIGVYGTLHGSLKSYGINYAEIPLIDGVADINAIASAAADKRVRAVFIQRSRGYAIRRALSVSEIGEVAECVHSVNPDAAVIVDNCYGEFTEPLEPTHVGADLAAGSLIKNPGGGLAPTGGYVTGKAELVERAASRLTAPGIGGECGPSLDTSRMLYQGLFLAPHTTAQALKTAVFCSALLSELGFKTSPLPLEPRSDIIQMVELGRPEHLLKFCGGIQHASPVDSYVTPEAWQMPGYADPVVMAAGTFVQGASIELSADGPMRAPYTAYLQGGLTYESGKLGIIRAVCEMMDLP